MAKISKRMKKALAIGLGAAALSKLGSAGTLKSGIADRASKAMAKDRSMMGAKLPQGRDVAKIVKSSATKSGPAKIVKKDVLQSGPFKMFGAKTDNKFSQSSIDRFKAANEAAAERRKNMGAGMKKVSEGPSLFGFRFEKPLFKTGGSVMAKCKMGRNKKTKIY
jgi:hypothetical protein